MRELLLARGRAIGGPAEEAHLVFPLEAKRYVIRTTELDVYRLTDPGHKLTAGLLATAPSRTMALPPSLAAIATVRPSPSHDGEECVETRELT